MNLASIPSPSDGVWNLGPLPLRAYALAIILGIIVAIWVGERRFVARGGRPGTVSDVAVWAIPFGLIGARAYHVATNPEFYFGDGKDPVQALYVWEGGLGIWGAIAFGALGAYLGCRFSGVRFTSYIDAVAPGVVLAQAIGRWGNYFNQELMGEPTDRPWAVEIDFENRPEGYLEYQTFHPTFLYESLWCIGVALVVILADRRWKLGRGRVFALYVALYTAGRTWIEDLRIDDAHEFGPFRLNVWVSLAIFVLAVGYFVVVGRRWPGREESVFRAGIGAGVASGGADDGPDDSDAGGGSDAEVEDEAEDKDEAAKADDKDESKPEEKADADAKAEADAEDKDGVDKDSDADAKDSDDAVVKADADTTVADADVEEKAAANADGKSDAEPDADADEPEPDTDEPEAEAADDIGADSHDAKPDADRSDDSDTSAPKASSAAGNTDRGSAVPASKGPDSPAPDSSASSSGSASSTRSSGSGSSTDSSDSYDSSAPDY